MRKETEQALRFSVPVCAIHRVLPHAPAAFARSPWMDGIDVHDPDACIDAPPAGFAAEVAERASALAQAPDFAARLEAKRARRADDEKTKPLAIYRDEELANMRRNFYGFDPSYHVARFHFVAKSPNSWTPRHLALHRELGWCVPEGAA